MFGINKKTSPSVSDTEPANLFTRLRERLGRTRNGLFGGLIQTLHKKEALDTATLEEIESRLLSADLGIACTERIMQRLDHAMRTSAVDNGSTLLDQLHQVMLQILMPVQQPLDIPDGTSKPFVILMVGVNGVGKTTTIGKLAHHYQEKGHRIMLAAGDTFRAAAIDQLEAWGLRNKVPVTSHQPGSDSAAVIYDAMHSSRSRKMDVLIADTAGRLHTQENLMQELKKIRRILEKFDRDLKCEIMLVVDAGTGQNALVQARQFNEAIGITGICITKLDGTAKGGIVFALSESLGIPIRFIGIGEQADDLRTFNADDYVRALLAIEP